MEPQLAETAFVDLREAQTDQTAFLCHRPFPQPDPAVFAPQGRRVCLVGLAQGPDLGGQLRLVSLSALQGGDAPLRRREGGLVSLLLHHVGQAVHCRSVGLLARLLRQTLADMDQPIQESGLQLRTQLPDHSVLIQGDSDRLYRVFQNLLGNALKYSLAGSRVYLTLTVEEGQAVAALRNTSAAELRPGLDYTQRFVRGDESRTDGGSGLGLSIASSFVQACGGQFQVETQADLFTALVSFPLDASPSDPR